MNTISQYKPTPAVSFGRPWLTRLASKAALRSVTVLVIDDDAADASLILNALERHPDVAATHIMDHPEMALKMLASGALAPDLILLDIHMPRINGFLFVERLRFIPAMAKTPIAFLTTSRSGADVQTARSLFVNCYVVKPDTLADLRARLDVVINRVKSGVWS